MSNLTLNEKLELENVENEKLIELNKIINASQNNFDQAVKIVLNKKEISTEDKNYYINLLLKVFDMQKKQKINTSNYDQKPYSQVFLKDFLDFLIKEKFTMSELKVLMAIGAILEEANVFGNVLLSLSLIRLAELSGVPYKHINIPLNGLYRKKVLIKDKYKSIYLNYALIFRGSKIEYDNYKQTFEEKLKSIND